MKNLLCLLIACLFTFNAFAQEENAEPVKGVNVMLLHTSDSSSVALKKLARILVEGDFEIDKLDLELGYLTTKDKVVGQLTPATYQYKIVSSPEKSGTLLTITGKYSVRFSASGTLVESMYWANGDLNHGKQCFIAIREPALRYAGARFGYKWEQK